MSRPRVLLVIGQLDMGGAEKQLVHLAVRLAAEGFEPEVAVFYQGGHLEPLLVDAGVPIHHIRRTSKIGLEAILHLRQVLRKGDHAIVHSFLWPANWRARVAGILARTPVIVSSTRSVETWLRPHHVVVDRILARRTNAIVVNAEAIRDFLVGREKVRPALIRVIRNGLDTAPFDAILGRSEARSRLGLAPDVPVVLIVGNLQPEKNHEDFLRMADRVRQLRTDARFIVVGDGERRAALNSLAHDLGLDRATIWAGFQPDVRPYLAACDVFLNTSRREGCCNAILEAMAAARPVVAYAVGGNPEVIADGSTGRLAPLGAVDLLAKHVLGYLDDPDLGRADGDAGARRVADHFSVEAMTQRTVGLYNELLVAAASGA